jgi:hypothetical protein
MSKRVALISTSVGGTRGSRDDAPGRSRIQSWPYTGGFRGLSARETLIEDSLVERVRFEHAETF